MGGKKELGDVTKTSEGKEYDWISLKNAKDTRIVEEGENFVVVDYIPIEDLGFDTSLCGRCRFFNPTTRECTSGYPKWVEELSSFPQGRCVIVKKPVSSCLAFKRREYEQALADVSWICAKLFLTKKSLQSIQMTLDTLNGTGTLVLEGGKDDIEELYKTLRTLADEMEKTSYLPTLSGAEEEE